MCTFQLSDLYTAAQNVYVCGVCASSGLLVFQGSSAMPLDRPRYVIDRSAYTLPDFDREFDKKSRQFPVGEKLSTLFRYRTMQ